MIDKANRKDVKVITLGISEVQNDSEGLRNLLDSHNILFVVGTVPLGIELPFYLISELFSVQGEEKILQSLKCSDQEVSVYDKCLNILSDYIVFLNPTKAVNYVKSYIEGNSTLSALNDDCKLKLILHICGMLERLTHPGSNEKILVPAGDYLIDDVKQNIEILESAYDITISDIELTYISSIVFNS